MPTLHRHLNEILRQRVAFMADGERFPTEAELCAEFTVSRMTVSKVLGEIAAEGLLERRPRRGTFVRKAPETSLPGAAEWLRDNYLGGVMSEFPIRTLRLNVYEYRHDFIRPMWDHLLAEFKLAFPDMSVEIEVDPERAAAADLIWVSNRRDIKPPTHDALSQDPAALAAVSRCSSAADYFPAAWKFLQRERRAGCPFALGTSLTLWNNALLASNGLDAKAELPDSLWAFFKTVSPAAPVDWQQGINYLSVPALLMQLAADGILEYVPGRGLNGLERPELAAYLACQRTMFETLRQAHGGQPVIDIHAGLELFLAGRILALSTFSPTLKVIPESRLHEFSVSTFKLGKLAPAVPVYMGIGTHCRDVSAAAAAVAFFCGRPGQRILSQHHNNIPARLEAAYSSVFLERVPHRMRQVLDVLRGAAGIVDLNDFVLTERILCEQISRYILSEVEWNEIEKTCQRKP